MYTYIKKSIAKKFVTFEEPLSEEDYNNIGDTWQDYLDNLWVPLSDEQITYHEEHPEADVKEVWDMQPAPEPVRTLEMVKEWKKSVIDVYDRSDNVNNFNIDINGTIIKAWLTPAERANYKNSIDAAQIVGVDELHPMFNGVAITISTQAAKEALAQIQLYADRCFIVTQGHKAAIDQLDDILSIDEYDHTAGYPEQLTFVI